MTENTERKKPGPVRRIQEARKEYHLKFVPAIADQIEIIARKEGGYQAYFDKLVQRDLKERQEREEQ